MKSLILRMAMAISMAISMVSLARADCLGNNLLNCFVHQSSAAIPYCSSYLSIPATLTKTITPQINTTVTDAKLITTTNFATLTVYTTTTTVTVAPLPARKKERRGLPAGSVSAPSCSSSGVSYPASKISSECSCLLGSSTTPILVTATAPPELQTITITQTDLTTQIVPTTVYDTATSTYTQYPPYNAPPNPVLIENPNNFEYYTITQFFAGTGQTIGGGNVIERNNWMDNTTSDWTSVFYCVLIGVERDANSFEIYYDEVAEIWECDLYADYFQNASVFNLVNSTVGRSYGYVVTNISTTGF